MNKCILGLTAIAVLCSPIVFADDTMGQDQQMTAPSPQDSMPSAPTQQSTSTTSTPSTASTDVQLKTMNGRVIHAQIDPQDLQGMNVGDKLELTDLGSAASATSSTGASNGTGNTTSSGASTPNNGASTTNSGTSTPSNGGGTTNNGASNVPGGNTDNTGTVNGAISQ